MSSFRGDECYDIDISEEDQVQKLSQKMQRLRIGVVGHRVRDLKRSANSAVKRKLVCRQRMDSERIADADGECILDELRKFESLCEQHPTDESFMRQNHRNAELSEVESGLESLNFSEAEDIEPRLQHEFSFGEQVCRQKTLFEFYGKSGN